MTVPQVVTIRGGVPPHIDAALTGGQRGVDVAREFVSLYGRTLGERAGAAAKRWLGSRRGNTSPLLLQ